LCLENNLSDIVLQRHYITIRERFKLGQSIKDSIGFISDDDIV
jgi:hypothetical protein